ncbi:tyrosine-type recombinase/integrase [Yinghuangia seranimata]|uniref:tyrosine-type recombinase/integrase n=1 Tax=Yinghuangia seranimata TaxID=408067 RepID=UPI00248B2A0A|nr:tyrosine-type recombinase/integrase [Yinghuangia seranimata]MDI2132562.1 tyrosine-type recombinase/integrase [Yinghuangia seranimata]
MEDEAEEIAANNEARRVLREAASNAWYRHDHVAVRAARAQLRALPPHRMPTGVAARHRIRATLRSALSDAAAQELVTINVAKLLKLPSPGKARPLVWTDEREAAWRKSGERPSSVMVWTARQTAMFLDRATRHRELFAMFHLVAVTGLRRGEVCGLRWANLDFHEATGTLHVGEQIVQIGWDTQFGKPKSDAGERTIALSAETVEVLRQHRQRESARRAKYGEGWIDSGLVFTGADGGPLHPARVSDLFQQLGREAGLPPIRLHDLRHGAATHALTAGVDVKVVQDMLGHSSSVITRDTYTSVAIEAKQAAADAITALLRAAAPAKVKANRENGGNAGSSQDGACA